MCCRADMRARSALLRCRREDLVKALLGAVSHDIAIHPHHVVEEVEGRATIGRDGSKQVQSGIARGEAFGIDEASTVFVGAQHALEILELRVAVAWHLESQHDDVNPIPFVERQLLGPPSSDYGVNSIDLESGCGIGIPELKGAHGAGEAQETLRLHHGSSERVVNEGE